MRKAPGQIRFKLTPAIKRTLHMVNNGYVRMESDAATGNSFSVEKGKATSRMLWMLAGNRMIERSGDGRMKLTRAGLALLGERDNAV